MPEITRHPHGTICYIELAATDTETAGRFYQELFGWKASLQDMGSLGTYTRFYRDNMVIAAMYPLQPRQREEGQKTHWETYISVRNCDTVTGKVLFLGGQVIAGPMDVNDFGRMSIIQDPTGGLCCLWQARSRIGIGCRDEGGTLCWTELLTPDTHLASTFFSKLLGWEKQALHQLEPGRYTVMGPAGEPSAVGLKAIDRDVDKARPHWRNFFKVSDAGAAYRKALDLGAEGLLPVTPLADKGLHCLLTDPGGADFGLFQPVAG